MKKAISVFLSVIMITAFACPAFASGSQSLTISDDGDFKILVLSDTQDDQYPAYDMLNFVSLAIKDSNPDLIVFTGDLVEDSRIGGIGIDDEPFREGVLVDDDREQTYRNLKTASEAVLDIFEESGIPYAIAMGNNDHKCGVSNEEWLEIFGQYKNNITVDQNDNPEDGIDFNVFIKDKSGKNIFNLWLMDTGRGGLSEEQLDWYKTESSAITQSNGGTPVPALLFQHIQVADIGNLFEECNMWDDGATPDGLKFYRLNKSIASGCNIYAYEPGKTTEEFKAWKEQGDVIGAYFGHQHVDGFTGTVDGIELGMNYGCEMEKPGPYGYRLITIHENDVKNFDNEIYIYEGSVKKGNAHFEKQEDEEYKEYSNVFEKAFFGVVNCFRAIKRMVISWFA